MNVPMLDQALMQARALAAQVQLPRAKGKADGREFTFVRAPEYVRAARDIFPKVGLSLRALDGTITPEGLTRVYRLTSMTCGDIEEWSTTTPLDPHAPPDQAAGWARTHSMTAVLRDLLWFDDGDDTPDPGETRRDHKPDNRTQGQIQEDARRVKSGAHLPDRNERPGPLLKSVTKTPEGWLTQEHKVGWVERNAVADYQAAAAREAGDDAEFVESLRSLPEFPPRGAVDPRTEIVEPQRWSETTQPAPSLPTSRTQGEEATPTKGSVPEAAPNMACGVGATRGQEEPPAVSLLSAPPSPTATGPDSPGSGPSPGAIADGESVAVSEAPAVPDVGAAGEPPASIGTDHVNEALEFGGPPTNPATGALMPPVEPSTVEPPAMEATDEEFRDFMTQSMAAIMERDEATVGPPVLTEEADDREGQASYFGEGVSLREMTEAMGLRLKSDGTKGRMRVEQSFPGDLPIVHLRDATKDEVWKWLEARAKATAAGLLPKSEANVCGICWGSLAPGEECQEVACVKARAPAPPPKAETAPAVIADPAQARRERAARWSMCPGKSVMAKTKVEACAECGELIDAGPYRQGLERPPEGTVVKRRSIKPTGRSHQACVDAISRGEDPKSDEGAP